MEFFHSNPLLWMDAQNYSISMISINWNICQWCKILHQYEHSLNNMLWTDSATEKPLWEHAPHTSWHGGDILIKTKTKIIKPNRIFPVKVDFLSIFWWFSSNSSQTKSATTFKASNWTEQKSLPLILSCNLPTFLLVKCPDYKKVHFLCSYFCFVIYFIFFALKLWYLVFKKWKTACFGSAFTL